MKWVVAALLALFAIACADLQLMGPDGETRHYIFICIVSDTLWMNDDAKPVVCRDLGGVLDSIPVTGG